MEFPEYRPEPLVKVKRGGPGGTLSFTATLPSGRAFSAAYAEALRSATVTDNGEPVCTVVFHGRYARTAWADKILHGAFRGTVDVVRRRAAKRAKRRRAPASSDPTAGEAAR